MFNASNTRHPAYIVNEDSFGVNGGGYGAARKRVRSSDDPLNLFTSPASPDVQRPGQRRRIVAIANSPSPSEDSLPDLSTAPKRIMRGPPGSYDSLSSDSPPSTPNDERFTRFKLTMPQHPLAHVKAAWDESAQDVRLATQLLQDSQWSPKLTAKPSEVPASRVETGRVKELDEAKNAERAAIREKGKKSMIYQNRVAIENKNSATQPAPTKPTTSIKRTSPPPSPDIAFPRRKRTKKAIVDSDSDEAYQDSGDDHGGPSRQTPDEDIDEVRALSYFNSASVEALQELTGTAH